MFTEPRRTAGDPAKKAAAGVRRIQDVLPPRGLPADQQGWAPDYHVGRQ